MNVSMAVNKNPNKFKSEDVVGYSNNFFWLLDGATSQANGKSKDLTSMYIT